MASSLLRLHDHTQTHNNRQESYGRVIGSTQRLIHDNIQHSQKKDIHAPVGFEPVLSATERSQTHILDRAVNRIDQSKT